VEKVTSENEQLKKQINQLENRLNQLDAEAKVFAEKLTELKQRQYHDVSPEQFELLWDEFNEMLKKQEETQHLFSKVEGRNSEIAEKLDKMSSQWQETFGVAQNIEDSPQVIYTRKVYMKEGYGDSMTIL
jgi:hypothetical protein